MPIAIIDMTIIPKDEPTKILMMLPTIRTMAPTKSHLLIPDISRLIKVARLAIKKKTPAVPPKAVITSSVPFLKPRTIAINLDSIKPMKKVKPKSTATPFAECLVFSIA